MTRKLSAILIDPDKEEINQIEIDTGIAAMYKALSRPGATPVDDFNAVQLTERETLWVDGEGFLKENIPVFKMTVYPGGVLAGRGLILGTDSHGESISTQLTIDKVESWVNWTDLLSTGDLAPTQKLSANHIRVGDPITRHKPLKED